MPEQQDSPQSQKLRVSSLRNWSRKRLELWLDISRLTLREPLLRLTRHIALLAVIALGVWAARSGLDTLAVNAADVQEVRTGVTEVAPTPVPAVMLEDLPPYRGRKLAAARGISRTTVVHTVFPDRPRLDIIRYVVQSGDTLFGIADNFGLEPETVLWGNFEVLEDDPHRLQPGQELNIPPVDGTVHTWHAGDGLSGVAAFFGVNTQEIIDWPGNNLDPSLDVENPEIEPGTMVMIPGGKREIVSWSAPRIYRSNPAAARIFGPGYCGSIVDGPIGNGWFVWPAVLRYLSGFRYSSIHPAIDIAGDTGHAIFASDSGVVVYSGWNNYGYGYVVVLDHGNGWQTLYAHLSAINVGCGQGVFQGQVIAAMGSSGNSSGSHLHFELMHDEYGKVDPLSYLQ
jgi:murein DD-endopeptidase MepM/ murein hydrolase activator NlpD